VIWARSSQERQALHDEVGVANREIFTAAVQPEVLEIKFDSVQTSRQSVVVYSRRREKISSVCRSGNILGGEEYLVANIGTYKKYCRRKSKGVFSRNGFVANLKCLRLCI